MQEIINNVKLKRRSYYFPGLAGKDTEKLAKSLKVGLGNVKIVDSLKSWESISPTPADKILVENTFEIVREAGDGNVFKDKDGGAVFLFFFDNESIDYPLYDGWNEYLQNTRLLKHFPERRRLQIPSFAMCKLFSKVFSLFLSILVVVIFIISGKLFNVSPFIYGSISLAALILTIVYFFLGTGALRTIKKIESMICSGCDKGIRRLIQKKQNRKNKGNDKGRRFTSKG